MPERAVLLAALLSLCGGLAYAYVGWRLSRRRVEGPSRLASTLFGTWWGVLAALTVSGALARVAVVEGWMDFPLYLTYVHLSLLALCVALWALLYYLVYLLTGSRRALVPITLFYAALFVYATWLLAAAQPRGVLVEGPRVLLDHARPLGDAPLAVALLALLAPHIVASTAYFLLWFRVETATQRYRVGLVSVTLFGWFLSAALGQATRAAAEAWWLVASASIGLAAAFLILAAYLPPRWVRRRYGVRGIDDAPADAAA